MKFLPLILLMMAISCKSNGPSIPEPPTDAQVEAITKKMFEKMQEAVGAGGYTISAVKVLTREPGTDALHYHVNVEVIGMHKAPPLANPVPDQPFREPRHLQLEWRNDQWMETDQHDMN